MRLPAAVIGAAHRHACPHQKSGAAQFERCDASPRRSSQGAPASGLLSAERVGRLAARNSA